MSEINDSIDAKTIDTYVSGIANINNCIGKLDVLKFYAKDKYPNDMVLNLTIENIVQELISFSGLKGTYNTIAQTVVEPELKVANNQAPSKASELRNTRVKKQTMFNKVAEEIINYKIKLDFNQPIVEFDLVSSNLKCGKYNTYVNKLTIIFNNKRAYIYSDVPQNIVLGLVNAESVGKYFNEKIKGVYKFDEVTESVG